MTFKFKRKRILLSGKSKNSKAIGYARATHNEYEYLEEQIKILKEEGCSLVFSEFISLDEEIKPQLNKAINSLSKGDQLIITELDRAFKNKKECLITINKLIFFECLKDFVLFIKFLIPFMSQPLSGPVNGSKWSV